MSGIGTKPKFYAGIARRFLIRSSYLLLFYPKHDLPHPVL